MASSAVQWPSPSLRLPFFMFAECPSVACVFPQRDPEEGLHLALTCACAAPHPRTVLVVTSAAKLFALRDTVKRLTNLPVDDGTTCPPAWTPEATKLFVRARDVVHPTLLAAVTFVVLDLDVQLKNLRRASGALLDVIQRCPVAVLAPWYDGVNDGPRVLLRDARRSGDCLGLKAACPVPACVPFVDDDWRWPHVQTTPVVHAVTPLPPGVKLLEDSLDDVIVATERLKALRVMCIYRDCVFPDGATVMADGDAAHRAVKTYERRHPQTRLRVLKLLDVLSKMEDVPAAGVHFFPQPLTQLDLNLACHRLRVTHAVVHSVADEMPPAVTTALMTLDEVKDRFRRFTGDRVRSCSIVQESEQSVRSVL